MSSGVIKRDTLAALRQAPIHLAMLFPDHILKKAEEDIAQHESKDHCSSSSQKKACYQPYDRPEKLKG